MKDDPEPMVGSGTVADRAERLTRTIRDQSSPNLRPRDSATLILIDRSGTVPKVLLGRRHERHRFLPGKFVFPGGRVEIKDRLMPTSAPLHARDGERLMQRVKRQLGAFGAGRFRSVDQAKIGELLLRAVVENRDVPRFQVSNGFSFLVSNNDVEDDFIGGGLDRL